MFGMAGGSAGQFVVGPLIAGGMPWSSFWIGMGVAGLAIARRCCFVLLPKREPRRRSAGRLAARGATRALAIVFRNPQSILCGMIAGLLFIPTTIFDMIWGVRYLQEAHGFDYGDGRACARRPCRSAGSSAVRCSASSPTASAGASR